MLVLNWAVASGAGLVEDTTTANLDRKPTPMRRLQGLDNDGRSHFMSGGFRKVHVPWLAVCLIVRRSPKDFGAPLFPPPAASGLPQTIFFQIDSSNQACLEKTEFSIPRGTLRSPYYVRIECLYMEKSANGALVNAISNPIMEIARGDWESENRQCQSLVARCPLVLTDVEISR